ncbi:TetR/AcrR family transcriptional regulator [Corynebacterium mayonis]|uniref:TetR/AcrR family transcriptional regulator n=1 Tax=Corynebacterium mayonis TaxID=3062461 RepID=UPI0031405077
MSRTVKPHAGKQQPSSGRGRPGYSREEVIAAAIDEFLSRGYEATSMGGLATRLGISKSAIYHHVSSKEQLLEEATTVALDALSDIVVNAQQMEGGIDEKLRFLIDGAVEVVGQRQAEIALLLRLRGNSEVEQRALKRRREITVAMVDLVAQGQQAGVLRDDITPGVAARLIFGTVNSMVDWYRPDGVSSLTQVGEMLQKFVWTGLSGTAN